MSNWSSQFEKFPAGSDFGSVSCYALKELKDEFYSRLQVEHDITEGATPVVTHKVGNCTVCLVTDQTPVTTFTIGGIQYNTDDKALYKDSGLAMSAVAGKDHGSLINLLAEDAHTQYIVINKASGTETFSILTVPSITGLDETESDYTADNFIMPQSLHLGTDPNGGAKHDDGTFTNAIHFGIEDLNVSESTIFTGSLTTGTPTSNLTLPEYSFMPFISAGDYFEGHVLPGFTSDLSTLPDDYTGVFVLDPTVDSSSSTLSVVSIGA